MIGEFDSHLTAQLGTPAGDCGWLSGVKPQVRLGSSHDALEPPALYLVSPDPFIWETA